LDGRPVDAAPFMALNREGAGQMVGKREMDENGSVAAGDIIRLRAVMPVSARQTRLPKSPQ